MRDSNLDLLNEFVTRILISSGNAPQADVENESPIESRSVVLTEIDQRRHFFLDKYSRCAVTKKSGLAGSLAQDNRNNSKTMCLKGVYSPWTRWCLCKQKQDRLQSLPNLTELSLNRGS